MIYFLIISASVSWACFTLFSSQFNHLDNLESYQKKKMTEKDKIFYNLWCCVYKRRYNAKLTQNWDLYWREHQTLLMCLNIAKVATFDSEKPKHLK